MVRLRGSDVIIQIYTNMYKYPLIV